MIITPDHPKAMLAMIIDEQGNNLVKQYAITEYDTETQMAEILEYEVINGHRQLKTNGKKIIRSKIHLPGTTLKFREP